MVQLRRGKPAYSFEDGFTQFVIAKFDRLDARLEWEGGATLPERSAALATGKHRTVVVPLSCRFRGACRFVPFSARTHEIHAVIGSTREFPFHKMSIRIDGCVKRE